MSKTIPRCQILSKIGGFQFFFSRPGTGLTNRVHFRDSRAGAPLTLPNCAYKTLTRQYPAGHQCSALANRVETRAHTSLEPAVALSCALASSPSLHCPLTSHLPHTSTALSYFNCAVRSPFLSPIIVNQSLFSNSKTPKMLCRNKTTQ